jgi:hypothetical protein
LAAEDTETEALLVVLVVWRAGRMTARTLADNLLLILLITKIIINTNFVVLRLGSIFLICLRLSPPIVHIHFSTVFYTIQNKTIGTRILDEYRNQQWVLNCATISWFEFSLQNRQP